MNRCLNFNTTIDEANVITEAAVLSMFLTFPLFLSAQHSSLPDALGRAKVKKWFPSIVTILRKV